MDWENEINSSILHNEIKFDFIFLKNELKPNIAVAYSLSQPSTLLEAFMEMGKKGANTVLFIAIMDTLEKALIFNFCKLRSALLDMIFFSS